MTACLLDTSLFIFLKDTRCKMAGRPDFWEWLLAQSRAGSLASIDMAYREIVLDT